MVRGRPRTLPPGMSSRDVRRAAGGRRVELQLSPDEADALRRLREATGETTDAGMLRRLIVEADGRRGS